MKLGGGRLARRWAACSSGGARLLPLLLAALCLSAVLCFAGTCKGRLWKWLYFLDAFDAYILLGSLGGDTFRRRMSQGDSIGTEYLFCNSLYIPIHSPCVMATAQQTLLKPQSR